MKTFLKMIISSFIITGTLIYCDYLAMVILAALLLVFIWDNPRKKKEVKNERD